MAQPRTRDAIHAPAAVGVGWRTFQLLGFLTAISWLVSYALFLDGYTALFAVFGTGNPLWMAGGIAYFLSPVISLVLIAIAVWPGALSVLNGEDAKAVAARSVLFVIPVLWMVVVFVGGSAMMYEMLHDPLGPTMALPVAGGAFFHVVFQHWFQGLTSIALALAPEQFRTLTDSDRPAGTGAVVREVTTQIDLERRLGALHEAMREMMAAKSSDEVADIAARAADDVLDIRYNRVHLRDEDTDELVPAAWSEETERALDGKPPTVAPGSGLVWEAFRSGEKKYYHDFNGLSDAAVEETELESTLLLPLDRHGIMLVQSTGPTEFSEEKIELANILSAATEAALTQTRTEQQLSEAEQELELAQCLLDEASESVLVLDPETERVLDANEPASRQLGYTREELLAATAQDVVADLEGDVGLDAVIEEARERGRMTLAGNHRRKDGSTYPVQLTLKHIEVDEGYLLVLAQDVTERTEYRQELRTQRTELELLGFLQRVVDELIQQVLGSSSRANVEHRTCARLTESPFYADAWLVDPSQNDWAIGQPKGTADGGKVRSVDDMTPGTPMTEAVDQTIATDEAHIVSDLPAESTRAERDDVDSTVNALPTNGADAAIALPLTYGESNYGALIVVADQTSRKDLFGAREQSALETLAVALAFGIHVRVQDHLTQEEAVELEFRTTESNAIVSALAATLECRVRLEGLVPGSDDAIIHYYTVETDRSAGDIRDMVTAIEGVDRCRILHQDDECVVEVRLHSPDLLDCLVAAGAVVDAARACQDDARLVVNLQSDADVRTVEALVRETGSDWSETGRREIECPVRRIHDAREAIADRLTAKQREALLTAYFSGYYEYPRTSDAQEVADTLAIANTTLYQHLQGAQRKLIEAWFDAGQ